MWLTPRAALRMDAASILAGCKSRSDFVERAINFYAGYLAAQNHTDFFAQAIAEMVSGAIAGTENRIARLQFKEAVELAKLTRILASMGEVDEESLRQLHIQCVNEVKRINGVIRYEDAVKYQKEE